MKKDNPIIVCAAVVLIVGLGTIIGCKVKKMCNNINSNRQRFEDPPEQPPTNNIPPGLTNNIPTNAPPTNLPAKKRLAVDIDNLQTCDVSTVKYSASDPDGYAYLRMVSGKLESSDNLQHWQTEGSFNLWTSPYWATVICYDAQGVPIYTNSMPIESDEIPVAMPQLREDGPVRFFRVVSW